MRPNLLAWIPVLAASALVPSPFAVGEDLKVCLVSGSAEYDSDRSLASFKAHLEERYRARCRLVKAVGFEDLPGLEALEDCDVALFFTRRLTIDGEPLARVKRYCESGRPLVAVRTASHGFQRWLEFDREVLGGNYTGHHGNGPTLEAKVNQGEEPHPILEGVGAIRSRGSLYKTAPLAADAHVLLTASTPRADPQPAAWTRMNRGGRVFYTSLGSQGDFENSSFKRLLANALFWAAGREVDRKELPPLPPTPARAPGTLSLRLRSRVEPFRGSGAFEELTFEKKVPVAEAAILICDMWDEHWCRGATERCEALARKMAPVVDAARARGVQVIHCPSETTGFYAERPQRRRMIAAPPLAAPPAALDLKDPPLPIDDTDGGCDTEEKPWYPAWTRQSPHLSIGEEDGISDQGEEVYRFIRSRGTNTVLFMGVHTNMCILGRSFGIRQMARRGVRCILVRDLTDTMYDPRDPPRVSHDEGTELVVEHIEKHWCPSILSADLLKGLPPTDQPDQPGL